MITVHITSNGVTKFYSTNHDECRTFLLCLGLLPVTDTAEWRGNGRGGDITMVEGNWVARAWHPDEFEFWCENVSWEKLREIKRSFEEGNGS